MSDGLTERVQGFLSLANHSRGPRSSQIDRSYYAISSHRGGSMQTLMDTPDNVMLGYGYEPSWTECAADGTVLLEVGFGSVRLDRKNVDSSWALKMNWTGSPFWGPGVAPGPKQEYCFNETCEIFSIHLHDDSLGRPIVNDTVYFSWNGATELESWVVLASNDRTNLTMANFFKEVPDTGFEDHIFIGKSTTYVAALAVSGSNTVLGITPTLEMNGFRLFRYLGGGHQNNMEDLTVLWQKYVAEQRQLYNLYASIKRYLIGLISNLTNLAPIFVLVACFLLISLSPTRQHRVARRGSRAKTVTQNSAHVDGNH
ncbi:hypothetical protein K461DRAFT_310945, partial [Myriangium duriaei CBS 260.36]